MKDLNKSNDVQERIQSWIMILILRLYGLNVYTDDSYVWQALEELENKEDVDAFFLKVLHDFKTKRGDLSRLYKLLQKNEDILSR